jgi:iron complex outermembrane receptor protein
MRNCVIPATLLSSLALHIAFVLAIGAVASAQDQANPPAAPAPSSSAGGPQDLSDLPLEDLMNVKVYAASKFAQDVAQAPASVTIVGGDEIRRHGYRTLADVLRQVRGFYVTYDRNYSYVGVRGFLRPGDYNGRVLLLVNGHPLNDSIFEQALLGTESPIDIGLVERVEVIRGPSSSLYGTSAFFAVVNVITRSGRSLDGAEVAVEGGSQRLGRGRVTLGGRSERGVEGLFSISALDSRGNDRLYYPEFDEGASDGFAVDGDRDRSINVFASGRAGDFWAQAGFGTRTKRIPTAAFDTLFNDPREQTIDARGFAEVEYTRQLNARTSIELRLAFDHYRYEGTYPYDTGLFFDDAHGSWGTAEALFVRHAGDHAITVGTEQRINLQQDQSARDETGVLLDDRRSSEVTALFAEDEYRITPRLIANVGVRWDQYFGTFGATINPRLALIAIPFEGSALKLLYGRAFRAPNPFELYYDQNALSEKLTPERIQTTEIAWEQRVLPRLQFTSSVFHSRVHDLISQRGGSADTIDGLYFRNGDSVAAQGVEIELQGELPGRVNARLAQVLQRATPDRSSRTISNSPSAITTIVLDAPIPGSGAVVAFNGYYIGERRRVGTGMIDAAFVSNLSVSRRAPLRGLDVGFTIYNLFDAAYSDPGSVEHRQEVLPQDGRTAAVRLSWRF